MWNTPADLIMGSGFWPFVVSQRFLDLWRARGLAGVDDWKPVQVRGAGDPTYFFPVLPPPHVRADLSSMKMRWMRQPSCSNCESGTVLGYERVVICLDSWDGTDLFELVNRPGEVVASPRLAKWAVEHEISNFALIPANERSVDHTQTWKKEPPA
jgi:hypothetical protein